MLRKRVTVDGCTACAHVVHATNEVITIYPITPSSPIAELCDAKSAKGEKNIWGFVPLVTEMQSEAGAAGAVHGSLTTGALTTTITASQGLLLMIPDMHKIAGELTPTVFHVAARSLACQGLCIFGDHSDVMATRATGFAMLCSAGVQEVMDFALIAQAATLESRIPFVHFFDGFRTSHEMQKIEELTFDDMRAMVDTELVLAHRSRGLSPDRPCIRGTSQNPDVYFQGRESVNTFYAAAPGIVQRVMDRFAGVTGRAYHLFDFFGAPDAERVLVIMGSGGETAVRTVRHLNGTGERLGLVQVRLFRPFSVDAFIRALPPTLRAVAVLDRTKEPGSTGEPLYHDVRSAVGEAMESGSAAFAGHPKIVGGRYGLGSKEFTPSMVKAIFDNLAERQPKKHFTVGIVDDVTQTSLHVDDSFQVSDEGVFRALFFGLGSDGTVGANKNTIKIIGKETENQAQGYFVYDSKKAGAITVSHLRFGPEPIRDPYLIARANFIACHNMSFLDRYDILSYAEQSATFLLSTSFPEAEVWDRLPANVQEHLIAKKMKFYIIDAVSLAEELGLGGRINTIMQSAFFGISNVIPKEQAIRSMKEQAGKTYGKKGDWVVKMNMDSIDRALQEVVEVPVPDKITSTHRSRAIRGDAPPFVREVIGPMMEMKGDALPVSAIPFDGTWPSGTTRFEKRRIAVRIPIWEPDICIQCGLCSFVCPHATIRMKAYGPQFLANAPASFKAVDARGKDLSGLKFSVQVAPEDCTGCGSCVHVCPGYKKDPEGKKIPDFKAINMRHREEFNDAEVENYRFFLDLPETELSRFDPFTVKGSQFLTPLFEYHSSCAGCGETPYIKLLTQLFGDRLFIANATGCSSIYGGNLPTTPYCARKDGRGPVWSNSLFEDNAEFGLGMRQSVKVFGREALALLEGLVAEEPYETARPLADAIKGADQTSQKGIEEQRVRVEELKRMCARDGRADVKRLLSIADFLVKKSVWAIGGDGWAYDIGYGGLDHVLASGENVNILVLDTEVYSNTGGQMSKSTPLGSMVPFAEGGKGIPKKRIGAMMMTYGYVYVAQVAFGANPAQTVKAFHEAESYDGPSLIIAYSTCIAHGIDMSKGVDEQKKAVACGHWPLFRYDPRLGDKGESPLVIDSAEPSIPFSEYAYQENRYRALKMTKPVLADELMKRAQADVERRWRYLRHLASWKPC